MNKLMWVIMAFISGAFLPIQAGLNTKLGKAGESPVHASTISFVVGTVALLLYILFTQQSVSWEGIKSAPGYVWIGGVLGAFYVTVIILAFPQLGPGLTFGLVVAGQLIISALLEHFNVLVAQQQSISPMRVLGIVLVVVGVVIVRKF
ncbi:DMT family transporter [Marinoscillum sp. 108]|jgi:transporter family-2 protein|uniref:DMT family transporter n=1 Tax=Marinoscillum luteum TaxID=861051 RepID=A0ABW7N3M8_9BACT|nr:DMT family transporter [Marinoscillum sp. 108]VXD12403.1 EamA-like transporter family protein [Marinoscillum sp. 108]